jgi:hypothetical protein
VRSGQLQTIELWILAIVWSMEASACLTLAVMHLVIWFKQPEQPANLLFSIIAAATDRDSR